VLAGVSVLYYTRQERGDMRGVSESVPEARAQALRLDDAERAHLVDLARPPPGHPQVRDRLGMFVTAFRDGYNAPWRLLEATVQP